MSESSYYIELRCPDCGWRQTDGPAAIGQRLRRIGKVGPRSQPDWEILAALLLASTSQIECDGCGRRGVLAGPAESPDAAWPDVVSCEACGKPIPPERLEALPGTTLCTACQSNDERGVRRPEAIEYCPRCGAPMEPKLSRDRGITRYLMTCTAVPPCRPRNGLRS